MEEGEHVPAWKRLGLKVQEASNDVDVGNEKSLASQKRKRDEQKPTSTAEKKPPKRKKVPKSERQPPPEADQLAYLRQFHQDRANWKFSKQKQNWVLKHLYDIPEDKYGEALIAYIQGLQGASRDRVAAEARELINKWNEFMSRTDEQEEGEEQMEEEKEKDEKEKEKETETETEKEDEKKEKENDQKKEKEKESETKPPEEFQAKRAQAIVSALLGEKIKLVLIDEGDVETSAGKSEETQLEGTYDGTGGEQYDSEEVVKENDKNKEKKEEKKKQKEKKKKEKEEKKKQKEEKKKEKEEKKKEKEEKMKEKNEKKERKEKKKQDD